MIDCTAFILARGGSKGIKLKNLQEIDGMSLVRRSAVRACNAQVFSNVILSSDCEEILQICRDLPIICHKRSSRASSDTATSEEAIIEIVNDLKIKSEYGSLIQCTTPFFTSFDHINMVRLAKENQACTIVSGYFESEHHWRLSPGSKFLNPIRDEVRSRGPRQQGDRIFVENGGAYIFPLTEFLRKISRFTDNVVPYEMGRYQSIDIDEAKDLEIAHLINHWIEAESIL